MSRRSRLPWILGIFCWVLVAGLVTSVARNPEVQWDVVARYFLSREILSGLLITVVLWFTTMIGSYIIGSVVALARLSKNPLIAGLAAGYVWLFRAIPLLVQLLVWFNLAILYPRMGLAIPFGRELSEIFHSITGSELNTMLVGWETNEVMSPFVVAVVALVLYEAAQVGETMRGGIISVDKGQLLAAQSIGLNRGKIFWRIVVPQALRAIVPSLGSRAINVIKESSLASVIAVADLLYSAQIIYNRTYEVIPLLLVACLWYLLIVGVISSLQSELERRLARGV